LISGDGGTVVIAYLGRSKHVVRKQETYGVEHLHIRRNSRE
jgi:hypothetical protein